MKTKKMAVSAVVFLMVAAVLCAGCSPMNESLVGEWSYSEPLVEMTYVFQKDGTLEYVVTLAMTGGGNSVKKYEGECKTQGDLLVMSGIYLDAESKEYTYSLSEDGKTLTLTRDGEDLVLIKVE